LGPLIFATALALAQPDAAMDCDRSAIAHARAARFLELGQYLLSAVHFSIADVLSCQLAGAERARLGYALAMFRLGEQAEVTRTLRPLADSPHDATRREARLLQAIVEPRLSGAVELTVDRVRLELWQSRGDPVELRRILASEPTAAPTKLLQIVAELESAPSRSPVVAGLLSSVVPGLGQAFVGAWRRRRWNVRCSPSSSPPRPPIDGLPAGEGRMNFATWLERNGRSFPQGAAIARGPECAALLSNTPRPLVSRAPTSPS
jgi:hypothetical protein